MAVLILVVGVVSSLYTEIRRAWVRSSAATALESSGRDALDLLARDLECAAGDASLLFRFEQDGTPNVYSNYDYRLYMVSLRQGSSTTGRLAHSIAWWVRPMAADSNRCELVRSEGDVERLYGDALWFEKVWTSRAVPVAENITFFVVAEPNTNRTYTGWLPPYLDLCLETVDRRVARQPALVMDLATNPASPHAVTERGKLKVFSRRVYFANRSGLLYR